MNRLQFFPVRIFIKFFVYQLLAFNFVFFIVLLFLKEKFLVTGDFLKPASLNFFIFSFIVGIILSYFFTVPIWRVILKTQSLIHKNIIEDVEEILQDEYGEYSQLEYALNKISKKMKKRKEQLTREREENQAFMSSVAEGLVSLTKDEKILYFNAQFAAQFVSSELLKLENGLFLKDIFRWPELVAAFKQTLKSGQTQRLTVQLNTLLDEKARFFAISIAALRKPKTAEIYGGIGIFHDITELKRSEQIRIDFVGNASHELRTPLTSLKGYVETLKEDFQEKNFSHFENFLNILSTNVDRLIDLVNDLLTISSLESHPDLRLELIEPLQLTENVVNEFQALANEKKQMIQVSGQIPAFKADAGKIEQILRNLISNAIKYIPEYKQITILWEALPDASVVLKVKDNGPGIPKEHHDRLFERFYRIDKGRARDAGGTGLGLSIVKHIVQSHKGQVKMFSDPENGGGTEFICIFPRIA